MSENNYCHTEKTDMSPLKDLMIIELRELDKQIERLDERMDTHIVIDTGIDESIHKEIAELQKSQREMLSLMHERHNMQVEENCKISRRNEMMNEECNKLKEHVEDRKRWHEDHYLNHEKAMENIQLLTQAQDRQCEQMAKINDTFAARHVYNTKVYDEKIRELTMSVDGHKAGLGELHDRTDRHDARLTAIELRIANPVNFMHCVERIQALEKIFKQEESCKHTYTNGQNFCWACHAALPDNKEPTKCDNCIIAVQTNISKDYIFIAESSRKSLRHGDYTFDFCPDCGKKNGETTC